MLQDKSWRTDAIVRLFLSVIVCLVAGTFLVTAVHYAAAPGKSPGLFYGVLGGSLVLLGTTLALIRTISGQEEELLLRLALALFCFYGGLMLGAWAGKLAAASMAGPSSVTVVQMIVSALSLQGAVLVLVRPFLREHQTGWGEGFGLGNRWAMAVLLGLLVGFIFLPIGWLLQSGCEQFLRKLHVTADQQQVVQTFRADNALVSRIIFGIITVALVPPAEECFFRGILYPWIKRAGYPRTALWSTSLIFAASHTNLISFVPLALFSVALTLLYERTSNLLAPISAHAFFNAANLVALFLLEAA